MTISREGFGTPVAGMERISWVAVHDKQNGVIRMTTWSGVTKRIVVIGLPPGFVGDCPCSFALPTGAEVHEWPMHAEDGVVFTVLADRTDHVSLEPDGRLVFVRSAGWIRMSPNPSGAGGGTGGGASIDGAVTIAGDLYSADGGGRGEAT